MCGFAGYIRREAIGNARAQALLEEMSETIYSRGPDGVGYAVTDYCAFTHRRLSILDVSEAGHQPMSSHCGQYQIVFNGEIYNHLELRDDLEKQKLIKWKSYSDTETLLEAVAFWGLETALKKVSGMFAFALWDYETRTLHLARDRMGEKPLYYGWAGNDFVFASQLSPIQCHPYFEKRISKPALSHYFKLCYVPAPLSIWENIFKLNAGCCLTLPLNAFGKVTSGQTLQPDSYGEIWKYWSLDETIKTSQLSPISSPEDAVAAIDKVLQHAVKEQLISDVPLGAFLSGGIDSSLIVALMQRETTKKVKTYTIGFEDKRYDESGAARDIATYLQTDHTELIVTPEEIRGVIPNLANIYDEPFADSSQIPTFIVSKLARESVTVALSGDGGDELFGGYNKFFWLGNYWKNFAQLPFSIRKLIGLPLSSPLMGLVGHMPFQSIKAKSDKAMKLGERLLHVGTPDELYLSLTTQYHNVTDLLQDSSNAVLPDSFNSDDPNRLGLDDVEKMMYWDSKTYLADDILCKVDRAAMSNSLETRTPYLHADLIALAWQIPRQVKMKDGVGKWPLREVLFQYVPRELYDRPKAGFGIPVGAWLSGPLRKWAESLISPQRLESEGYLRVSFVQKMWKEHLSGRRDWTTRLWTILMFQAWLERQ